MKKGLFDHFKGLILSRMMTQKGGLVLAANFIVWLQAVTSFSIKNGVILLKKGSRLKMRHLF